MIIERTLARWDLAGAPDDEAYKVVVWDRLKRFKDFKKAYRFSLERMESMINKPADDKEAVKRAF